MLYRSLGSSGIEVSAVGLGAWAIGGWMWGGTEEGKSIAAIQAALDQGINLIDTAPAYGYGRSEEIVGRAIHGRRDRVVLATKCGLVWDREEGQFFFHCRRQGGHARSVEVQDLPQPPPRVHPRGTGAVSQAACDRLHRPLPNALAGPDHADRRNGGRAAASSRKRGKSVRSGSPTRIVEELQAYGRIDSDQEKYSLLDRQIEEQRRLDHCRRNGIAMLAYSPLANGLLTGKIRPDRPFARGRSAQRQSPLHARKHRSDVNAVLAGLEPIARRRAVNVSQLASPGPAGNRVSPPPSAEPEMPIRPWKTPGPAKCCFPPKNCSKSATPSGVFRMARRNKYATYRRGADCQSAAF